MKLIANIISILGIAICFDTFAGTFEFNKCSQILNTPSKIEGFSLEHNEKDPSEIYLILSVMEGDGVSVIKNVGFSQWLGIKEGGSVINILISALNNKSFLTVTKCKDEKILAFTVEPYSIINDDNEDDSGNETVNSISNHIS